MQIFCNGLGGTLYIADVRLLVLVQRGRHADGNRVHIFDKREIGCGGKFPGLHNLFENIVHNVPNVVMPCIDQIYLLALYVKANGLVAGLGELRRKRQAHIAQAHNTDHCGLVCNFIQQLLFTSDIFHTYLILNSFYIIKDF